VLPSVALGATVMLFVAAGVGGAAPARPSWVVDRVVVDTGRARTQASVVGRDAVEPVAARIRLVAPRGSVRLSVDPVCIYGHRWVAGGNTVDELESRGRPIVRLLSLGLVPRPRSRSTEPTYCRWKVTALGVRGTMLLELQIRDA
jgi:hypothetical protein